MVKITKDKLLEQARVQGRDSIDGVAGHDRQVGHADHLRVAFFNQGELLLHLAIAGPLLLDNLQQEAPVDFKDNAEVPRQDFFKQGHGPLFKRLGQQCVVGVGKHLLAQCPCRVPVKAFVIQQDAHQLSHADSRVGIVQLDRHFVGKLVPAFIRRLVTADDVSQGGRAEKVLLNQA